MTGIRSSDSSWIDDRRPAPTHMFSSRQESLVYPTPGALPVNQNRPVRGTRLLSSSQKTMIAPGTPTLSDRDLGALVGSYTQQRKAAGTKGY